MQKQNKQTKKTENKTADMQVLLEMFPSFDVAKKKFNYNYKSWP